MRINELLTESLNLNELSRPPKVGNAAEILNNAGYDQLGQGAYARVFGKPGANHVLKLFSTEDSAYLDFVSLVNQHPNPHFPKFKGKMMKVTDNYYAIQMEKLTAFPDNDNSDWIAYTINNYTSLAGERNTKMNQTKDEVFAEMRKLEKLNPNSAAHVH